MTTPRITREFAYIGDDGSPGRVATSTSWPGKVPVVVLTAEDYERIVAALRPFGALYDWTQSVERSAIPGLEAAHLRKAAEILKEIEGER